MNNRFSLMVQVARNLQKLPLGFLRFLESPIIHKDIEDNGITPAIFVLALPRSGSTLVYQAICHALYVNYLSNVWNMFYQLPCIGGWISSHYSAKHLSTFKSDLGFVEGVDGPAEGQAFWKYWTDCGMSGDECDTLSAKVRGQRISYIRRVLLATCRKNKPFATTYIGHVLIADKLSSYFRGAVFVRLRRDPVDNALSILKARGTSYALDKWFSVQPKQCDSKTYATQHELVAAQVYWLNKKLDASFESDEVVVISYEELCKNPEAEMEKISDWCHRKGLLVTQKFELPSSFQLKERSKHDSEDIIKIESAMGELEKKYGTLNASLGRNNV